MHCSVDVNDRTRVGTPNDGFQLRSTHDSDVACPTTKHADVSGELDILRAGIVERKLMTKIDMRLIPVLTCLYTLAFLDRTNVANAAVFGLAKDLGLHGHQYQTALMIFFVPYILFEIPSNIILKKLKPHVWLSLCMFIFGLVTLCQGLVRNWGGFMTTRFMLGVSEAGLYAGCFYSISMWYRREEAQKRYTFFFSSTSLAGAFGGLLASAIGKMDGLRSYKGWRWIFILEGLATCIISLAFFFIIPDFPEDAKWLTPAEAHFVKARLQQDQGDSGRNTKITVRDVINCFKDYKFFIGGFMYFGLIVPAYGYAYFAPTIIRSYGYSPIQTQLYSVPPWVVTFVLSMVIAACSDFFRHRFMFALIPICVAIVGFSILLVIHHQRHVQYGALFLAISGVVSALSIIVCWFQMNLGGHLRRSVGSAWQIGFGNLGGIIATYIFPSTDAIYFFHFGYSICVGFICLSTAACIAYFVAIWIQNHKRDKTGMELGLCTPEDDLSPNYRYML